jgi:hypothetical protein
MHKFVQWSRVWIFFATNAPDPPHWTQTHVLGHIRPFRYCTNFSAKWVELVQLMHKFMPRSLGSIFRNECTRSTLSEPKLVFWGVLDRSLLHELQCKTGRIGAFNAQVRSTKSYRNFSQRTHPIHPIGPQTHVWCLSDRFDTAQKSVQNRLNWCN